MIGIGERPNLLYENIWIGFDWPGPSTSFESGGHEPVLESGTAFDGVWRLETTLLPNAPVGEYNVLWLGATDLAGNEIFLKRPELEARAETWPLPPLTEADRHTTRNRPR
jgi:hypothetical protein